MSKTIYINGTAFDIPADTETIAEVLESTNYSQTNYRLFRDVGNTVAAEERVVSATQIGDGQQLIAIPRGETLFGYDE